MGVEGEKSVNESLQHLCLSDHLSDVHFTFGGSSEKLPAHRLILSMRSPVFKNMFYGSFPGDDDIEIIDSDIDAFRMFLRYVYTENLSLDLDVSSMLKVLYLAKKYWFDTLVEKYSIFLRKSINSDNACLIYCNAKLNDLDSLRLECFEHITTHAKEVFASDSFLDISKETLDIIIAEETLFADEETIFNAVYKWGKEQCKRQHVVDSADNVRKHLGDIVYRIRFPLIPLETFRERVCPYKVLSAEEETHLSKYMITGVCNGESVAGFSANPRGGQCISIKLGWDKELRSRKSRRGIVNQVSMRDVTEMNGDCNRVEYQQPGSQPCQAGAAIGKLSHHVRRSSIEYSKRTELIIGTSSCLKLQSISLKCSNDVALVRQTVDGRKVCRLASFITDGCSIVFDAPVVLYSGIRTKIIISHFSRHVVGDLTKCISSHIVSNVQIRSNSEAVTNIVLSP